MLFFWQQNKELLWLGEARPFSHEAAFWNTTATFKVGADDCGGSPNKAEQNWTHWYFQVSHRLSQAIALTGPPYCEFWGCDDVVTRSRTRCKISHVWSCPLQKACETRVMARLGLHCLCNNFLANTQGKRQLLCWNMAYREINGTYLFPSSQTLQVHLSFLIIASVPSPFQNIGICKIRKGEGKENQSIGSSVTMMLKLSQCLPL